MQVSALKKLVLINYSNNCCYNLSIPTSSTYFTRISFPNNPLHRGGFIRIDYQSTTMTIFKVLNTATLQWSSATVVHHYESTYFLSSECSESNRRKIFFHHLYKCVHACIVSGGRCVDTVVTPRACARVKQSVLSVCLSSCHIGTIFDRTCPINGRTLSAHFL